MTVVSVPTYKATTLVEIKAEAQKLVAFQDIQVTQAEREFYQTQYDVLRSRNLAKRVIERLKLADEPAFKPPPARGIARAVAWLGTLLTRASPHGAPADGTAGEQKLIDRFLDAVEVTPRRNSYLVEASFFSPSPTLAANVANALAEEYVALALDQRLDAVQKGRAFIEKQLGVTKAALEHSEEDLQAFARANQILTVDAKQNIEYRKLQDLNEGLTKAQHERMVKESLYNQVRNSDAATLSQITNNEVIARLTSELATHQAERARLVATFTPEYPDVRRLDAQIGALRDQIRAEQNALAAALGADFEAAQKQEALLLDALEGQKRVVNDLNQRAIDYKILKREVDTNRGIYQSLLQRLKEVEVTEGIKASNIQVIDVAEVPLRPAHPRPFLNLALALLVGSLGGVGIAFLQAHLDNAINTPEDVERYLRVPALGTLPELRAARGNGKAAAASPELTVVEEPQSMGAEALRTLRAALFLSSSTGPPQRLLVTSAGPQEGKTCISANLALLLAQAGRRVVLVDCDFRRPRIHRVFGVSSERGVSTFLTGRADLPSLLLPTPHGVDVLPSGPPPPNPVELIDSPAMTTLLEELARRYEFVLVDAPPTLGFADVPLLARRGCGVLVVVRAGETPRRAATQASDYLQRMGAMLVGVVLNRVRPDSPGYYGSYLGYYAYYGRGAAHEADEPSDDAPPREVAVEITPPPVAGDQGRASDRVQVDWDAVPRLLLDPGSIPAEIEAVAASSYNHGRPALTGPGKLRNVERSPYRAGRKLQGLLVTLAEDLTRAYVTRWGCPEHVDVVFPQIVKVAERYLREKVVPLKPASVLDVFLSPYYGWVVERLVEALRPDTSRGGGASRWRGLVPWA